MKPMLQISGPDKHTLREATSCILDLIKAAGTETAVVASVNALVSLAKGPEHVNISNCTFTSEKPARRGK